MPVTIFAAQDNFDSTQQFATAQKMPFPVLFDPAGKVMRQFTAGGLPGTFVLDRNGKQVFTWVGQISPAMLNSRVTPLLTP